MNMISLSVLEQVQPLMNFQRALNMDNLFHHHRKDKVVVIIGATGTGKSKLAIDLATRFPPAEIVNSDKMQVYKGLNITTNKVTDDECHGVPHHLLGIADPNSNFTADDFSLHASSAIHSIIHRDSLPIVAGGSNSYIEALFHHRFHFDCCFLWVDVAIPVLDSFLSDRVDRMIQSGQLHEVRPFFDPEGDYSIGIRRAIGVPEFHHYFQAEASGADERTKNKLLEAAIANIKANNCSLAYRQLQKIHRLHSMWNRNMYRLDATQAFIKSGNEAEEAWQNDVVAKSHRILHKFLYDDAPMLPPPQKQVVAVAAASH